MTRKTFPVLILRAGIGFWLLKFLDFTYILLLYFSVDDRIQWVRTMEVFAMIAMIVSLLCGLTKEYVSMYNRMLLKIGAGSGFTAG